MQNKWENEKYIICRASREEEAILINLGVDGRMK
jgi:hypothetical protein